MRALILVLALAACAGEAPTPEPSYTATAVIATCDDFAEIFCVRAVECFPALPADWCTMQESQICTEGAWTISETCLDDVSAAACSRSSLAVPCSCNPDQDRCEADP